MEERFSIMLPYRIAKSNAEYAEIIRKLVRYIRSVGIKVFGLNESDILDEYGLPVEHVYLLKCFGNIESINNVFDNRTTGHYGETVLYA